MPLIPTSLNAALASDLNGSFEQFVLEYQDRIFRFALRFIGNPHDAEEIAQDAFVRAYQALQSYERARIEELNLKPWLYTIALNVARNRTRAKKAPAVSLDAGSGAIDPAAPNHLHDPHHLAELSDLSRRLAAAIVELPPRYRSPVILRHIEGLSFAEISATLDQPVGTAKSNVHRGVRMLREALLHDETIRAESSLGIYSTALPVAIGR